MRGGAGAGGPFEPVMYTIEEVAVILKVCDRTIWVITNSGELPYIKFGRSKRILDSDLKDFMARKRIDPRERGD
jgi:excisionase family DNA binding protein